jgi:hypothetical protein
MNWMCSTAGRDPSERKKARNVDFSTAFTSGRSNIYFAGLASLLYLRSAGSDWLRQCQGYAPHTQPDWPHFSFLP